MAVILKSETPIEDIANRRKRYLAYTDNLMMAVIDFYDGPTAEPDPPHSHPHEQVSFVAAGKIIFFLDGKGTTLEEGDMYTVPPNVPHTVQLLSEHVRLIDSFTPVRDDFL
jgi:quercetin dioxygenase-like cupin family protein